jgi:hypothetical protein
VHQRVTLDFKHHLLSGTVTVDLSTIGGGGGIFDPILSDFQKSDETALEKCLVFA